MVSHFVWFWHKFFVSFVSVKAVSFSDSIPMRTVATSPVVLRWLCDSPRTGCAWRITTLCMWREQAIIEWSRWSDLGEWPLTMLVNLVNSWWCLLTVTTRVISSGDLYCCLLKHCFLNIIYVRPRCGAFCDAHHFKILVVFAIFTSSFKSFDMKYAYHVMGCCNFSSKPSLSVYFCQKPENIWLASQISGTTVPMHSCGVQKVLKIMQG